MVDTVKSSAYSLLTIINDILDFSKIDAGKLDLEEIPISMTAEDFSYYSHKVPACFYRLGIKNVAKGITSSVHNDTFNIDESAIETGMGLMAWSVLKELT